MDVPKLPSFADQISADPLPESGPDEFRFISRCNPERLGNVAPIAYGGCTIAIAVHAAHQTVGQHQSSSNSTSSSSSSPPFHLYSVLGAFHGPTKTDRKLNCTVTVTRNTKTFATRRVVAWQAQDDGSRRACADFFIDFHVEEPASLLEYDAQPTVANCLSRGPQDPVHTGSQEEILQRLLRDGHITQRHAVASRRMFHMATHFLETRYCTSTPTGVNLLGTAPSLPTPQDHLPLPQKASAEWLRTRWPLASEPLQLAALAFMMDQALSFLPLNHDHKGFTDAGACSTLEFALRVFVPTIDLARWHLRERRSAKAGHARTFSEGCLWTEAGELVCSMTQTSILRPPPPPARPSKRPGGEEKARM